MVHNVDAVDFEPEVVVLYCQQCVAEDADVPAAAKAVSGFKPRFEVMPCSSKVEASHLLKLLERGADCVAVVGCPEKLCRFLVGSTMAEKRIEYTRRLLEEVRMGAQRLGMDRASQLSAARLVEIAEHHASAVRALGPNPMKGATGQ